VPKLAETISSHKITEPVPSAAPVPPKIVPTIPPAQESSPNVDLNSCTVEQLLLVPGCPRTIAEAIVRFREKNGDYQKLEDLLLVPGMTAVLFALLTGQSDPRPPVRTLNELLGFPAGQKISLKDVCDRVASWPHITGIVLGHSTGLPMVGHVPVPFESTTIMAFAPKIFGMVNQSYKQFAGEETTEIIFPSKGTSFHLFHTTELYAVVLSNKRSLPKGQAKLLRQIIAEIVRQEKNKI
jgi:predicted regulator of Ras-like GTPase activity (Roadblock/LC7/MglB family)